MRDTEGDGELRALTWVTQTVTLDAVDTDAVKATEANPGWRLLHVATGSGGQTTLTYGSPWPGLFGDVERELAQLREDHDALYAAARHVVAISKVYADPKTEAEQAIADLASAVQSEHPKQ